MAQHVTVSIDLNRIRQNVRDISQRTNTPIYAVVKADAYGLGVDRIAPAIAELVAGWCVFSLEEAIEARLWERSHKPAITLGPPTTLDPTPYIEQHVRPAVSAVEQAAALRDADPILCVDTGMQRFACPPENVDAVIAAGGCREAFTHATLLEHVRKLVELLGGRGLKLHAAASSLMNAPEARLDAIRPGLAIYAGAVRATTELVEVHETHGALGYAGVKCDRHGVILCGYAQGLRRGPCLINGRLARALEVGMQSAYVEISRGDNVGDEVILLGGELEPSVVAAAWGCTPHEALMRLGGAGTRQYA